MEGERANIGFFHSETQRGEVIRAGSWTIVPAARSVRFVLPGQHAGMIWNRPVSVTVRGESGSEYTLPITDRTRQAQLAIAGFVCLFLLVFGIIFGRRSK